MLHLSVSFCTTGPGFLPGKPGPEARRLLLYLHIQVPFVGGFRSQERRKGGSESPGSCTCCLHVVQSFLNSTSFHDTPFVCYFLLGLFRNSIHCQHKQGCKISLQSVFLSSALNVNQPHSTAHLLNWAKYLLWQPCALTASGRKFLGNGKWWNLQAGLSHVDTRYQGPCAGRTRGWLGRAAIQCL